MEPIRDELLAALEGIQPRPATSPLVSTVTGRAIEGPELGPEYWWDNVRRTVRFADGVERLIELGCDTAVELSPHPVLAAAVTECYQTQGKSATVAAVTAPPRGRAGHDAACSGRALRARPADRLGRI